MIKRRESQATTRGCRPGAASLDYILTLSVLFIMSAFIVMTSRSIMKLVYEMTCFFLAWPFM